jgi:hypothetical protein
MNATTPLHIFTVENGIAVVTLNRPEAMNSLNTQLRFELMALSVGNLNTIFHQAALYPPPGEASTA